MFAPLFLSAAMITAQPLANEDFIEPSILNEVDHAVNRAPADASFGSPLDLLAAIGKLKRRTDETMTECALRLVSSQRSDGRWTDAETNDVTAAAVCVLRQLREDPVPPLRLSIFAHHIEEGARQAGIPFAEAAKRVKAMGYEGVDVSDEISSDHLATLKAAGFEVACVAWMTRFDLGYDESAAERVVRMAETNRCPRVLCVPCWETGAIEPTNAALRAEIIARTERFACFAKTRGITVMVEDFDAPHAPTKDLANLTDFLEKAPSVMFALDTGNFAPAGEQPTPAFHKFAGRIRHFHLKDRDPFDPNVSVAVGAGSVARVDWLGFLSMPRFWFYDGWYTVEHFGVADYLSCAEASAKFVKSILMSARTL